MLGANIAKILLENKEYGIKIKGVLGRNLSKISQEKSIFKQKDISVMGFFEVIPVLKRIFDRIKLTVAEIQKEQPDIVFTIDSPDFCFRVIKQVKKNQENLPNTKFIHLVAPSVWAYREKRAEKIAKLYDKLLVLYPFEPPYFTKHKLDTKFIGHPLIFKSENQQENFQKISKKYHIAKNSKIISITAGSRNKEIETLSPIYLAALKKLENKHNNLTFVIVTLPEYEEKFKTWQKILTNSRIIITSIAEEKSLFFQNSYFAIAKSGTNSLEIAKEKIPLIICYKVNLLSYILIKLMVKTKLVNIINIMAKKEIIPELIQYKLTAKNIFYYANLFLTDKNYYKKQLMQQNKYLDKFMQYDENKKAINPSIFASQEILNLLK